MHFSFRLVCCSLLLGTLLLQAQEASKPMAAPTPAPVLEPGLYAYIETTAGEIVCRLFPEQAPKTVENFKGLATGAKAWNDPKTGKEKHTPFYSGLIFHRVIKGFMIQGGDPLGTGEGGPGYAIDDEISSTLHFDKPGVLAMAKKSFPNSAGSQFFITTAPTPWLENNYSIFGQVAEGQNVVDAIAEAPTGENDMPLKPVTIRSIRIRTIRASAAGSSAKPSAVPKQ
jgi:peptidyl-prolyl cis-trans isomerase A (cyclophilin A)